MALPPPVEALWSDLESVRARLLKGVESLSQAQADWRARDTDWSVGEIIHHVALAEVGTGKVPSKVLKEAADRLQPCPPGLTGFTPVATPAGGRAESPTAVWPERGKPLRELVADMRAARERSEEHTSELQSRRDLVCRLLLEKKK